MDSSALKGHEHDALGVHVKEDPAYGHVLACVKDIVDMHKDKECKDEQ